MTPIPVTPRWAHHPISRASPHGTARTCAVDEHAGAAVWTAGQAPALLAWGRSSAGPSMRSTRGGPAKVGVSAGWGRAGRPRIAVRDAVPAPPRGQRLSDLALRRAGVAAGRRDLSPAAHGCCDEECPARPGAVPRRAGDAPERRRVAATSDDAFDAAVSALVLAASVDDLLGLRHEPDYALEGKIWRPRVPVALA